MRKAENAAAVKARADQTADMEGGWAKYLSQSEQAILLELETGEGW